MELTGLTRHNRSVFDSSFALKLWTLVTLHRDGCNGVESRWVEAFRTPALALSLMLGFQCLCAADLSGQTGTAVEPVPPRMEGKPGQTYAPVGPSGYKVPIPEIKMKSILGDRPAHPARKEETQPPPQEKTQPVEPRRTEQQRPPVHRLPFEPPVRVPPLAPAPEETEEAPPKAAPQVEVPPKEAPRVGGPRRQAPQTQAPPKEYRAPLLTTPMAPEAITEALPTPRKEVLKKGPIPKTPALTENEPIKGKLPTAAVERTEAAGPGDEPEAIPLLTRRDPEIIAPPAESEPAPETSQMIPPAREEPPVTVPSPVGEPAPARTPVPPARSIESESPPRESPGPIELPRAPAKEAVQSPLEQEVPQTREVRDYLKETAPILEELSLLMTRAPALTVADYDPSDPNAPVIPRDVYLKMEAMKRELQVLDSKTFAIIPPSRYDKFHELIRKSIAQTHQACDAMMDYFNETKPENLQKVQDHLLKAKELILRTRERVES